MGITGNQTPEHLSLLGLFYLKVLHPTVREYKAAMPETCSSQCLECDDEQDLRVDCFMGCLFVLMCPSDVHGQGNAKAFPQEA